MPDAGFVVVPSDSIAAHRMRRLPPADSAGAGLSVVRGCPAEPALIVIEGIGRVRRGGRPEVPGRDQGEIGKANKGFGGAGQGKKFRLIEAKLTAEDEELTPTMKLKRKLVNEKYQALIEDMYVKEAA